MYFSGSRFDRSWGKLLPSVALFPVGDRPHSSAPLVVFSLALGELIARMPCVYRAPPLHWMCYINFPVGTWKVLGFSCVW